MSTGDGAVITFLSHTRSMLGHRFSLLGSIDIEYQMEHLWTIWGQGKSRTNQTRSNRVLAKG